MIRVLRNVCSQKPVASAFSSILLIALLILGSGVARADERRVSGSVLGAGAPIAGSTVVLWATTASAPTRLAETKTNDSGRFELTTKGSQAADSILYLVATGGRPTARGGGSNNSAIALLAVLGSVPP
jgi:hypothetical protein